MPKGLRLMLELKGSELLLPYRWGEYGVLNMSSIGVKHAWDIELWE